MQELKRNREQDNVVQNEKKGKGEGHHSLIIHHLLHLPHVRIYCSISALFVLVGLHKKIAIWNLWHVNTVAFKIIQNVQNVVETLLLLFSHERVVRSNMWSELEASQIFGTATVIGTSMKNNINDTLNQHF